MITTKVVELDVYKNGVKIGHIDRDYNNEWVAWFVVKRNGPKTIYQHILNKYADQQTAINAVVKAYLL